jgi:adenylate cyclase
MHPRFTLAARQFARFLGEGRAVAISLLGLLLLFRVWDPAPIEAFRLRLFDLFQQLAPRSETGWPVVIVDIDEASLKELGQWPWPRAVIAGMVDRLGADGAAAIGFDMVFAEPDRSSTTALARFRPLLTPDSATALAAMPTDDELLAEALRRYGRAVLGQAAFAASEHAPETPSGRYPAVAEIGGDPRPFLFAYPAVLQNLPELAEAAAGMGVFSLAPEIDGIVRRVPAFVRVGDRLLPALSLETLRIATGQKSYAVHVDEAGVADLVIAGVAIPTDQAGMIYVRFAPHARERYVSAADVIAGRTAPGRFAGRLVLVGTSATGLRDLRATPVATSMPGVEVHAQLLEAVLTQDFLIRPHYVLGLELTLVFVGGLGLMLLVPLVGARWTLALHLALTVLLVAGSWLAFRRYGMLIDASYPVVAATLVYLFLAYSGFASAERQRKEVSSAFERYLSPVLVRRLARDPSRLNLGGESREMTVMFSDIRDFTAIAERFHLDPQGLTQLINRFLTYLGDTVLEHDGTIDKYIGDSLMAFWNAPLDIEHHAAKACAAALGMVRALDRLNAELKAERGDDAVLLRIGIGINTGACVVGNLGSTSRLNYSVLGDPVNLASRLEGMSKLYGLNIVISEDTMQQAQGFATLELDLVAVKGRGRAVRIYAVMGGLEDAASPEHQRLVGAQERMLAAYRAQHWDEAEAELDGELSTFPRLKQLCDVYRQRIALFRELMPPADWDGVFRATEK